MTALETRGGYALYTGIIGPRKKRVVFPAHLRLQCCSVVRLRLPHSLLGVRQDATWNEDNEVDRAAWHLLAQVNLLMQVP